MLPTHGMLAAERVFCLGSQPVSALKTEPLPPRVVRKDEQARDAQRQALGLPEDVKLLPAASADAEAAALTVFGDPHAHLNSWRKLRHGIRTQSIFAGSPAGQQMVPGTPSARKGTKRAAPSELAAAAAKQQRTQQHGVF